MVDAIRHSTSPAGSEESTVPEPSAEVWEEVHRLLTWNLTSISQSAGAQGISLGNRLLGPSAFEDDPSMLPGQHISGVQLTVGTGSDATRVNIGLQFHPEEGLYTPVLLSAWAPAALQISGSSVNESAQTIERNAARRIEQDFSGMTNTPNFRMPDVFETGIADAIAEQMRKAFPDTDQATLDLSSTHEIAVKHRDCLMVVSLDEYTLTSGKKTIGWGRGVVHGPNHGTFGLVLTEPINEEVGEGS